VSLRPVGPHVYRHLSVILDTRPHISSFPSSRETRSNPTLDGLSCSVKFLTNLGALLLLNIICLSPVLACMAPNAQMSAAERACCHIMKNECGQMKMPASHGCCQKTLPGITMVVVDKKAALFHPADTDFVKLMATDLLDQQRWQSEVLSVPGASPPGNFAPTISNLRI
jgi:hypothetical protein